MRAVNLMPADAVARRTSVAGSGAYVLLGGLAVLAAFAALWTVTTRQIDDRGAELQRANVEAQAAESRAAEAAPYVRFAQLARDRVATVTSLSSTRFDFAHGLSEVARVLPADVWLTSVTGTTGGVSAAPSPATNAAPAPKFAIEGCTRSQGKVAQLLARLRAADGVRSVELRKSTKPDVIGEQAVRSGASCPANRASDPAFTIEIAFAVPGAPKDRVDATGQLERPGAASDPSASAPASQGAATNATLNSPRLSSPTGMGG